MREILFKAMRIDNGEWVEGLLSYDMNGKLEEMEVYRGFCDCATFEIDPETICQYTGLTDKNGKRIWENDICIVAGEDGYFTVKWDDDTARFVLDGDGLTVDFDNYYGYECEVIGNVFDNPELLRQEE